MNYETLTEYGLEAASAHEILAYARQSSHATGPRRYPNVRSYVLHCRQLARGTGRELVLEGEGRIDGRLVAAGYQRVPAAEWILGLRRDAGAPRTLADFVLWYEAHSPRPDRVGSEYNTTPEVAYAVWTARPEMRVACERYIPPEHWHCALRGGHRWTRHAREIGRALRRSRLASTGYPCSAQALRRLGELDAALQHVALRGASERAGSGGVIRLRHLAWADVQRLSAARDADRSGRVDIALSYPGRVGRAAQRWLDRADRTALASGCSSAASAESVVARWLADCECTDRAVHLVLGREPRELAPELSESEAREWIRTDMSPIEWIQRDLPADIRRERHYYPVARWMASVPVVELRRLQDSLPHACGVQRRWMHPDAAGLPTSSARAVLMRAWGEEIGATVESEHVLDWLVALRHRGRMHTKRYYRYLGVIVPEDLVYGETTPLHTALEIAAKRGALDASVAFDARVSDALETLLVRLGACRPAMCRALEVLPRRAWERAYPAEVEWLLPGGKGQSALTYEQAAELVMRRVTYADDDSH